MSSVILTRVFRKEVETKFGIKPKLSIQTQQHGDKWLSTFKVAGTDSWNEGDTVEVDIQEKGDFINFTPRGGSSSSSSTAPSSNLEARVEKLEASVFGNAPITGPMAAPKEDVIQAEDLPDFGGEEEDGDGF